MFWTIPILLLLALWTCGMATSYHCGGYLHCILIVVVLVGAIRLIRNGDRF